MLWKVKGLHCVVVVHPLSPLRVLAACLRVDQIVRRTLFLCGRAEHRKNGKTNGLDRKCWRPIVGQNRKTNVTVAVDVRMFRNRVSNESHSRRVEWIAFVKLKLELECLAFVETPFGSINLNDPSKSTN